MRWLFLLLLVLNGCYLIWNLQDAPIRAKDITSAARGYNESNGIQLLSEAGTSSQASPQSCVFLGGASDMAALRPLAQRLRDAGLSFQGYATSTGQATEHWLRLAPAGDSRQSAAVDELASSINGLTHKTFPCEGIATPEKFE